MHRAGLDHGAGGGDKPMPALGGSEFGDGAGGGIAGGDAGDEGELFADGFEFVDGEVGNEGFEAGFVEVDAGVEKALGTAEENDAGVQAFAAFDPRDDPDEGVFKAVTRRRRGHAQPPARSCQPRPGGR